MENLIADLRYAARTLLKTPAFLLISVVTLALGIGGNIAIFTLVQAVLLQPLPFPQPERLVRIFDNSAGAKNVGHERARTSLSENFMSFSERDLRNQKHKKVYVMKMYWCWA